MDPYIDPDALDRANPWYAAKMENLARGDRAHRERAVVLDALPVKLTAQTTDACNLDCPHCQIPRRLKGARMARSTFQRVIDQLFPTLIEMHPTNLGEPLSSPWFREMCAAMDRYGVLLDLTTNGTMLNSERLEWIAPIARDIKVSFDGATAPTFERLRRGAQFSEVCENVRALVARLNRVAIRRPTVSLQMTLMRSNFRELPALIQLGASLGVSRVKAYHLFSFTPEMDDESLMADLDAYHAVLAEAEAVGEALGIELQCAEPAQGAGPPGVVEATCHLPWHESWVDMDGSVLVCHSHGGDVAGSLLESPFEAIWNGPLYQKIRAAYRAGRPTWRCDGCGMNCEKSAEHEAVPYDPENFLSPSRRALVPPEERSSTRWSGRMKQFELIGRRSYARRD